MTSLNAFNTHQSLVKFAKEQAKLPSTDHDVLRSAYRSELIAQAKQGFAFPSTRYTEVYAIHCRFVRTDEDDKELQPWQQDLAQTYYAKLFREYAIVDLSKHMVKKRSKLR